MYFVLLLTWSSGQPKTGKSSFYLAPCGVNTKLSIRHHYYDTTMTGDCVKPQNASHFLFSKRMHVLVQTVKGAKSFELR